MTYRKLKSKNIVSICMAFLICVSSVTLCMKNQDRLKYITKKLTFSVAKYELGNSESKNITIQQQSNIDNISAYINVDSQQMDFDETLAVSQGTLWQLEMAPEENETPLPDDTPKAPVADSDELLGALPYPDSLETHSGTIVEKTYGGYTSSQYINLEKSGMVRNCTSLSNETLLNESKLMPEFKIATDGTPQVLIMHTHTTESFEPYQRNFYDASFSSRTTDVTKNVVAVGNEIENALKDAGIGVIHNTTVHDYPQYDGSYQRSCETVKQILAENPTIKVVLDIHRDAISLENNTRIAPVTTIDGKKAAQMMIISGCDDGTMNMPNYLKNFRFASLLQQNIESDYPTLTRPVLFDYRNYNQELTTGSILIEIGSHGNSIDEAVYTGQLVGKSLAKALSECQ